MFYASARTEREAQAYAAQAGQGGIYRAVVHERETRNGTSYTIHREMKREKIARDDHADRFLPKPQTRQWANKPQGPSIRAHRIAQATFGKSQRIATAPRQATERDKALAEQMFIPRSMDRSALRFRRASDYQE